MFNLSLSFRSIEGKRFLALLKLEDNRNHSYAQRRVIQRFWLQDVPNSELFSQHCWNHHLSSSK